MKKRSICIDVAFLTLAILILDYWARGELIAESSNKHLLVSVSVFLVYYFIRLLLELIPWKTFRIGAGLVIGGCIGFIYGVDYNYLSTYGRFMGPHELSMLISDYSYWQNNIGNLLSKGEMLSLLLYILPAMVIFAGLPSLVLHKVLPDKSNQGLIQSEKAAPRILSVFKLAGSTALQIIVVPLLLVLTMKVIEHNNVVGLYTPEFTYVFAYKTFRDNPETYEVKAPSVEFPERQGDKTAQLTGVRKPNIVFILLESLNMKQTTMFGYIRDTTPHLNNYIKDNYIYDGIANSTTTTFSTTSLFSGTEYYKIRLNDTLEKPLLWWYTKFAGYENHVFTSQWLRYRNKGDYFIDRKHTDTLKEPLFSSRSLGRDDFITVAEFEEELPYIYKEEGQFYYINYSGTHFPYRVGEEYEVWSPARNRGFHPRNLDLTVNQYNNAVLTMDAAFHKTINILKEYDIFENSIVIVASDHGEAMMEHGKWGHGPVYWQEGIQAPIYVRIGKNVQPLFTEEELKYLHENQSHFVSNVDILPTVLDIIGVKSERRLSGRSLLAHYPPKIAIAARGGATKYAVVNSHTGYKIIVANETKKMYCMNLTDDPHEVNIAAFSFSDKLLYPSTVKNFLELNESCDLPYKRIDYVEKGIGVQLKAEPGQASAAVWAEKEATITTQ